SAHRERAGAFARADLDVLTVVGRYLTGAVEVARLHDQLKDLAATDSLTGLANRRCFFERFTVEIARSRRKDRPVTVVRLDVDGDDPERLLQVADHRLYSMKERFYDGETPA